MARRRNASGYALPRPRSPSRPISSRRRAAPRCASIATSLWNRGSWAPTDTLRRGSARYYRSSTSTMSQSWLHGQPVDRLLRADELGHDRRSKHLIVQPEHRRRGEESRRATTRGRGRAPGDLKNLYRTRRRTGASLWSRASAAVDGRASVAMSRREALLTASKGRRSPRWPRPRGELRADLLSARKGDRAPLSLERQAPTNDLQPPQLRR